MQFNPYQLYSIVRVEHQGDKWIYETSKGRLYLPDKDVGKVAIMNDAFAKFINGGHPATKYFELDGNRIIYCANLAIDAVPIRDKQIYLIERRDGRGWATPGGHIDEGETPTDAAHRELQEETLIKQGQYTLSPLSDKVRGEDDREVNVFVWPFRATVHKDVQIGFADDAIGGNWFDLSELPRLAFAHQAKFIQMAL